MPVSGNQKKVTATMTPPERGLLSLDFPSAAWTDITIGGHTSGEAAPIGERLAADVTILAMKTLICCWTACTWFLSQTWKPGAAAAYVAALLLANLPPPAPRLLLRPPSAPTTPDRPAALVAQADPPT